MSINDCITRFYCIFTIFSET